MSLNAITWRRLAAVGALSLLGACAQHQSHPVASNPPPVAPGPNTVWYTVSFDTNSFAVDANGHKVVNEATVYLQNHPKMVATIIGRTDTAGSNDYNMHLSHKRADAVRDDIVYTGKVAPDRVETRWTGETRQGMPMMNGAAVAENRVVDIAIH